MNDALPTEPPRLRRVGNVWNMVPKDQKAEDNLFSKILSFSNENKLLACFLEYRTQVVPGESNLLLAISFNHFLINEQESEVRLVIVDSEHYSN